METAKSADCIRKKIKDKRPKTKDQRHTRIPSWEGEGWVSKTKDRRPKTEDRRQKKENMKINDEHLKELEDEAIFVMREVAAQFEKKVILFSGGKDSIVLVHLARKAFWPAKMPFSLLHIDTGHNFEETLKFRDDLAKELGVELIVRLVQDSINQGKVIEETGINASRNKAQSVTLLDAIEELKDRCCSWWRPPR